MKIKRSWPIKSDLLACGGKLLLFWVYLLLLLFWKQAYSAELQSFESRLTANHLYLYTQFIPCILISLIVTDCFGETFRRDSRDYFKTFALSTWSRIVSRFLRLCLLLFMPLCAYTCGAAVRIQNNAQRYVIPGGEERLPYEVFPVYIPVLQTLIVCLFFAAFSLLVLCLTGNQSVSTILLLGYCALEAGPVHLLLGRYSLFRGAFNTPNYYKLFTPNVTYSAILAAVCFAGVLVWDRRK